MTLGDNPPSGRLAAYASRPAVRALAAAVAVTLTLGVGYAVGRSGPVATPPAAAAPDRPAHADHQVGGLEVARDGFALELDPPKLTPGRPGELVFRVLGPDGAPVTRFTPTHERPAHLVLVGRDLNGYQHVHPQMAADGTWRVAVTAPAAGPYRAFVDVQPAGHPRPVTLGADVPVPGAYAPRPAPGAEDTVVVDGYAVTLDGGLRPGQASQVLVWLGRDGRPVDDPQPYLGAYGHLVALRHGDLAYLHVHPAVAASPSSVVAFGVQVPSAGTYTLFFEFKHRDVVRLATFTLTAS